MDVKQAMWHTEKNLNEHLHLLALLRRMPKNAFSQEEQQRVQARVQEAMKAFDEKFFTL